MMNRTKKFSTKVAHRRVKSIASYVLAAIAGCFAICIVCSPAGAQISSPDAKAPALSASEIVTKMAAMNEQRAAALRTYTTQRTYELDYSGFPSHKHAKMVVDVSFKSPHDKQLKIVSEEGSELLRNRVLRKLVESEVEANDRANKESTALTEANYEFTLQGTEQKDGRNCYLLSVKPRTKSKFLYEGNVWVDAADFAVVHIQARPAKNPSFWIKRVDIEHQYGKFGIFWLPLNNQSISSTRLGGRAVLAIDYGSYKVEPGATSSAPKTLAAPLVSARRLTQQNDRFTPEAASDSPLRATELVLQLMAR